jgi:hypothetical protein
MQFGLVWIGFEKSIQNPIRSSGFHKKNIQTHPKIFGFLRFSVFLDRFAVFIWIGLDLSTPTRQYGQEESWSCKDQFRTDG